MNSKKLELSYIKSGTPFFITMIIFLSIFTIATTFLIFAFNMLITRHDQNLSEKICSLISEKMNNSIRYMTDSAQNMSSVLSAQDFSSLDEIYETLSSNNSGSYVSIGFIDAEKNIYASEQEKLEFEKWNLLEVAELASPISISTPYRSATTGQPVFTMFTGFRYQQNAQGWLFVTYPLNEIQNIASTESLKEETEIWLMNAESANIIQCAGANEYSIGSWANAYLAMRDINPSDKPAYDKWRNKMLKGERSASLTYSSRKTTYTQVYADIEYMPGWYVVVRIPSSALSATMGKFRNDVIVFIIVLLAVTVMLFIIMHKKNTQEKNMLEQLSIHDPLTSVMNRRAFDFAAEQRLSRPGKKEACLLFFDVDYFKQVNDRFGHEAGDRILIAFSAALKKYFGESGIISRYGGDEFVVLLDTASKEHVTECLQQLTTEVHQILPTDDAQKNKDFTLSFSAGAACFPQDAETLSKLEQCADEALYIVKERGRDGYEWYHSAESS